MDVRNLRRIPEERVTAVLGVPAIVAGLGAGLDRSTFANFAEAREAAYESLIIPIQRLLAAEVQAQLLPEFERDFRRFRVGFDLTNVRVLQEDTNSAAQRWETLVRAGIATRAEARAYFGLPVDDAADRVYLMPLNVVTVPANAMPASTAAHEPRPATGDEDVAMVPQQAGASVLLAKADLRQRRLIRALAREGERLAELFAAELAVAFLDLGERAASVYLELARPKSVNGYDKSTEDLDEFDQFMLAELLRRLRIEEWRSTAVTPLFEQHYLRVLQATVETVNLQLGLGVNLPDYVAREIVRLGGKRVGLVDLDDATRSALFQALSEARSQGEGPPAAARRIRQYVPAGRFIHAGPRYRALLIARTETKYAQNLSTLQAYRQSPVVVGVMAFDGQLPTSDEDCRERDGRIFTFEEADRITEIEHPNGTLSWAPVTR
jgi:hypothetical protein